MPRLPTVSVVIPTYNRAPLLSRAIRSVQAQSFHDWELIVVDDASTDDTSSFIASIDDDRVRGVSRSVNGGVAAAQNTGIDHANGRYIGFLHSDDEYLPERLSKLVVMLDGAPRAVGAESGFELDEAGRTVIHAPYLAGATSRDLIQYRVGVHMTTLLLRRDDASDIRFDERLRGVEDRDFCIQLLRRGSVVTSCEPLARIHRASPRLGSQRKGPIYEYLLAKYADEITPSPDLHASWLFRIARAHARAGDFGPARRAMREAVACEPRRLRRWPLLAAASLSDAAFDAALRAYLAAARKRGQGAQAWKNHGDA